MTDKKDCTIRLRVSQETRKLLEEIAEKHKVSKSEQVRRLLDNFACTLERKDVKSVLLQIPNKMLRHKAWLQAWLEIKAEALTTHFFEEKLNTKEVENGIN